MSTFINNLANKIIESEGYLASSESLFKSYVNDLIGGGDIPDRAEIKKLITSAQVFYKSEDKSLSEEGAALLSMILDICAKEYPDIVPIAHSLFANSGDFPNNQLLKERYPGLNFRYSIFSEARLEFRETLNTVEELSFPLTDFQRSLWEDLKSDQDVITSAPTSAGKTHIILNYLLGKIANSEGAFAAVLVPTRALIAEVSGKIYELANELGYANEIEICTVPKEGSFGAKTFFVMTQERLHEILLRGDIYFDYLFIDEAHNIADKSRGVLLHLTVEKMLEDSLPQVIISMPSSSYQNSFSTIFKETEFEKEITQRSPVAKIIMSVVPENRDLIISRLNSSDSTRIKKGFNGKKLADIVFKLGADQSNIIYRNRTDQCESLADEIAVKVGEAETSPLLAEAANYIEEFIHRDFTLAGNLKKGVAFHYGPLPSSVRVMVENLVKSDEIKFVTCTSTLAEGVNLPAKNLFLYNPIQQIPYEASERIENVSIKNITGRAGRMLQHFSGNIFLIEPDSWQFTDYFEDSSDEEDKIPTYFKSLNEELDLIIMALRGELAHDEKDQYRLYTIANKLIREYYSDQLGSTLSAEELSLDEDDRQHLSENVEAAYNSLKVATFTLEANPTLGYIQQNKLFAFLNELQSYDGWILPHPKSTDLYEVLLRICEVLNDCGIFIPTEGNSLEHVCVITQKWVWGKSLKEMISEQIERDAQYASSASKKRPSVNGSVRNVIKVIDRDIRFRLTNALRCYQVLLDSILIENGIDASNTKIHAYVEIGASEERMINLINIGLSREAAKDVDDNLPSEEEVQSSNDLRVLLNTGRLEKTHTITRKELSGLLN